MDQFHSGLWILCHVVEYARHIITMTVNEGATWEKGEPEYEQELGLLFHNPLLAKI